jgi:hypothetical protein
VGVRIVTNPSEAVAAAEQWTLSAASVIEIGGGANPEVPLYQVTAVQALGEGRVAVGTNSPAQALVFEADGSLAVTLGREGDGPGEFWNVASLVALASDSILVWDRDRRRISVFTGEGVYSREAGLSESVSLSPLAEPSTSVPAGFTSLVPLTSGTIAVFSVGVWGMEAGAAAEPSVTRTELPSKRIDSEGVTLASYGSFRGMEFYYAPGIGTAPYAFGATTSGAGSGDALVVGTGESPEVRFYGPDGALDRIVRWGDSDRSVVGSMPARDWLVFGAEGTIVATVRTPAQFEPGAVRGDRVWGVFRDELDVESVRAYRITKP